MLHRTSTFLLFMALCSVLIASSCSAPAPASTSTPEPTAANTVTPTITPTITETLMPTSTPTPTTTPDLIATQRYEEMYAIVQDFSEMGYVASTAGTYVELDDFGRTIAKIDQHKWWPTGKIATSFVFSAHFIWSTSTKTTNVSGCGVVFALQESGDHFAVFLDRSVLRFVQVAGRGSRQLGKASGSDAFRFDNPAEADFTLVVNQNQAYVFVDDYQVIVYSLDPDVLMKGELGLGLRSGTDKGYGTACRMTNIRVWIAD